MQWLKCDRSLGTALCSSRLKGDSGSGAGIVGWASGVSRKQVSAQQFGWRE